MNRFRLATALAFALLTHGAVAAVQDYDLLIVACRGGECERLSGLTVNGRADKRAEYVRDGLSVQIEPIARRAGATDARILVSFRPVDDLSGGRADTTGTQRVRLEVEPCTLKRGTFNSVATFHSDDTVYRIWARLAPERNAVIGP